MLDVELLSMGSGSLPLLESTLSLKGEVGVYPQR
jgi:hypothetical protein